jgi:hypothetical protein
MIDLDAVVNDKVFAPFYGWHDDHRERDRTAEYRPASQQVRAELMELLGLIACSPGMNKSLELGLGIPGGTHRIFDQVFPEAWIVEWGDYVVANYVTRFGDQPRMLTGNTRAPEIVRAVGTLAPFDFLFMDAGHLHDNVVQDHANYAPMVRPGGIIAIHDSLERPGFEVEAFRFLAGRNYRQIGSEVGIAVFTA